MNKIHLSPKQGQAVVLLAMGKACKDVAASLGVTPETISRWKREPHFLAGLNQLRHDLFDTARDQLLFAAPEAVTAVKQLLNSANQQMKLEAAKLILKMVTDLDYKGRNPIFGCEDPVILTELSLPPPFISAEATIASYMQKLNAETDEEEEEKEEEI